MCSPSFKCVRCLFVQDCGGSACQAYGGGGGVQRRGLNRVQHPDRQCTRQQNYVLAVHANNNYRNLIVNQCGAGWGGFEGAGSWAMRNWGKGGGGYGGSGGGG